MDGEREIHLTCNKRQLGFVASKLPPPLKLPQILGNSVKSEIWGMFLTTFNAPLREFYNLVGAQILLELNLVTFKAWVFMWITPVPLKSWGLEGAVNSGYHSQSFRDVFPLLLLFCIWVNSTILHVLCRITKIFSDKAKENLNIKIQVLVNLSNLEGILKVISSIFHLVKTTAHSATGLLQQRYHWCLSY